jgi:hypothetical protein
MLKELTKADWLSILGIPEQRIPSVLLLRGTRNLKAQFERYRQLFSNTIEIGCANGIVEDVLIGDYAGKAVAYASVYGAAMASEIVHIFGALGTRLVIQSGCCGALADGIEAGDLFVATAAFCGEGAAQYYKTNGQVSSPSPHPAELSVFRGASEVPFHQGRLYTTSALLAEGGTRDRAVASPRLGGSRYGNGRYLRRGGVLWHGPPVHSLCLRQSPQAPAYPAQRRRGGRSPPSGQ